MAAWVRWSRGRLVYAGRISRGPFNTWVQTAEGQEVVNQVAAGIRFSLLGKARAAASQVWRQLAGAAGHAAVAEAIDFEVQAYLPRLGALAFAEGLPRNNVDLRRVIVVPTVLLNGAAYTALARRLNRLPAWTSFEGGDAVRAFFVTALIGEIAAAVAGARPSPRSALAIEADWIIVGMNTAFVWRVPVFQAPPWDGHMYVLELTRGPINRAVQKAVAAKIDGFEASLPSLSRAERNDVLRRALHTEPS